MNISKHFKRAEFACSCGCGFDTVDHETLNVLEKIREHFDKPVVITSGCRCPDHNKRVGGAPDSHHIKGRAVDFRVQGVASSEAYDYLDQQYYDQYGIGLYSTWVHIDTRSEKPARW